MLFYGHGPGHEVSWLHTDANGWQVYWCATCQVPLTVVTLMLSHSTNSNWLNATPIREQDEPIRTPLPLWLFPDEPQEQEAVL
jgi:hypothetical protein